LTSGSRTNFLSATNAEQHLEAHLDALVIGGTQALDICAKPDDIGELYASVCLFCVQNKIELIKQTLLAFDYDNKKQVRAVTEALCHYWLKVWDISWLFDLADEKKDILSIIKKIITYHGLNLTPEQSKVLKADKTIKPDPIILQGFNGDISAIADLINYLSQNNQPDKAAISLNLITGADLFEDVFIPEEIDEDILFDDETGSLGHGINITRLCQNPKSWQAWWDENKNKFDSDLKYRNGKPCTPSCLLDNLKSKVFPNFIREFANQELISIYNIDVPFLTSMTVTSQINAISKIESIIDSKKDNFEPGKRYEK
ncbi:MAG: hypothetical protein GY699_04975, partial [Desulfobacteraceae bacterium]|nr:hypothetical protein [Desulfobacteraceae bacterium]